jgi:cytochrome c oxidase subunit 3/cytochrome o ubiquinol oxidase subunit 3
MDRNVLGVLLLCASDLVLFALLIVAYLVFHGRGSGPDAATVLNLPRTAAFSVCLWASSGTIWVASRQLARDDRRGCLLAVLATVALGAAFFVGQILEWSGLVQQGVTLGTNLFGTTFFTLTGLHGLHVVVGLVMWLVVAGFIWSGDVTAQRSSGLEAPAIFWHFVDAVWVVLFGLVYLGARL